MVNNGESYAVSGKIGIVEQFRLALFSGPKASVSHSKKTAALLVGYFVLGLCVFGVFSAVLLANEDSIKLAVMHYIFPESWHSLSERAIDFFFESQSKVVIISMIASGSLVMTSMLLFPVKEYCSSVYENHHPFDKNFRSQEKPGDFPLWLQALEETKLLFIYLTFQMMILALGYYPFVITKVLSNVLSIVFLCFTFGLDFIAPTLQRHRKKYSHIIKFLMLHPVLPFVFGAIFTLPVLFLGQFMMSDVMQSGEDFSLISIAVTIFLLNLVFLTLAVPAGTRLGMAALPTMDNVSEPMAANKKRMYGVMTAVFLMGAIFHGAVIRSMHHKSQILKCDYAIAWDEVDVDLPSLTGFFSQEKTVELTFPLHVTNTTPFDLDIEDSLLVIKQNGIAVSVVNISHLNVPSGEKHTELMNIKMDINAKLLSNIEGILDGWSAQLEFDLLPGIPFILPLAGD